MKISVVTISFNQARYLRQALDSVLAQTGPDLEYIVIDAGSADESPGILQEYAAELAHVVIEADDGPADGLNKGLDLCSGEVFFYLNADDFVLPGAFDSACQSLAAAGSDVLLGAGIVVDAQGRTQSRVRPLRFTARAYARGSVYGFQQSSFFRRSAIGDVRFNVRNRTCWDGEFLLDLAAAGARFSRTSRPLGAFRLHGESISGSGRGVDTYRLDRNRLFEATFGRTRRGSDDWLRRVETLWYRGLSVVR